MTKEQSDRKSLVRSVDSWRVLPPQAAAQHVKDAAQHPPIINPGLAARLGKVRSKPLNQN
jgi:hypothetical protein